MAQNTTYDPQVVRENIRKIFSNPENYSKILGPKQDWQPRQEMLNQAQGPPMVLVSGKLLGELGYLPRYDECVAKGYHITFEEYSKIPDAKTAIFLSHRWLRPSLDPKEAHPDDHSNSKAKVAAKLTQYNKNTYKRDAYFWVDWCCIDQDNSGPGALMLPLYVACVQETICYVTDGYFDRAWCRCERAIACAVSSPRQWLYYPKGSVPSHTADFDVLHDPAQGQCTMFYDLELVKDLAVFCKDIWRESYKRNFDGSNDYVNEKAWRVTEELNYGQSEVYYWVMNHFAKDL